MIIQASGVPEAPAQVRLAYGTRSVQLEVVNGLPGHLPDPGAVSYQRAPARWVLKHPTSLWRVPETSRAFPGVRFVWTHRSPEVSVASYCSLVEAGQTLSMRPGRIDLHAIGWTWLGILADGAKRAAAQRAQLPDDAVVDVVYDDLVVDPRATLKRTFDRLDMTWTMPT